MNLLSNFAGICLPVERDRISARSILACFLLHFYPTRFFLLTGIQCGVILSMRLSYILRSKLVFNAAQNSIDGFGYCIPLVLLAGYLMLDTRCWDFRFSHSIQYPDHFCVLRTPEMNKNSVGVENRLSLLSTPLGILSERSCL